MQRHPALAILMMLAALAALATGASATCTINGTGMILSPVTASTGTYTSPTTPTAQAVALTVTGTYTTNAGAGTCMWAFSFQRGTYPPATMALSGGTATLPYTIQTTSGGGNTLLFSGTSVSTSNVLEGSFASAGANLTNKAFSVTSTIYFLMQPNSPQQGGSYSDSLTFWYFNLTSSTAGNSVYSSTFTVTGTVTKTCTIGGVSNPSADNATIPITAAGAVTTTVINKSYASVACNTPSNLQLTSSNGAVTTPTVAPSGFQNFINYSASATFGGATATLDTSTNAGTGTAESGTAVSTSSSTTPSGTMTVAITPQAAAKPLLGGTYTDTLSITITPQ